MSREIAEADTQPAGSRLGDVVAGKYRLEKLLGRGGMGEVYEARHVVVGRRFAVKFLHAHLARGRDAATRFTREARAAGELDSPHIAAVLDFDTTPDGSPFLVMEYLTGESLAATLSREKQLPVRRALAILLQICEGLDVAHQAGIVHRDVKPDNVFVTKPKDGAELIKILDFGVAKLTDPEASGHVTQSGAVLGTPFYMAPEQARGEKSVDLRVDVYAVGVLAYELFSGQKPHPGAGYNAILAHILTQPVTPLATLCPELPPGLVAVVERALSFDAARRQSSAALLATELAPFAGREVPMVDSHFDLRATPSSSESRAAHTSAETSRPSAAGTFASAVGDVRGSRSGQMPSRRAPWVLLAVGIMAAALVALEARQRSTEPREPAASASVAHSVAAQPSARAPEAAAVGVSSSSPERAAPVASASAAAISAKKRALPPDASSRTRPAKTTFDEKNPY